MQPTRTIVCPECGLEESLTLPLYVRADDASVRKELIEGRLGTHPCSGCGFAGFAAFPLLWDDAENDLLTMLVKDDSETLLDDFEELLRRCRGEMGETAFQLALERNYQIVTSVTALCEMVTAAEVGRYCYRSSPGLTEADDFDRTSLVIAAKTLRQAGHLEDAYDVVRRLDRFPTADVAFHRELGAYAFEVGEDEVAKSALLEAKRLIAKFSHVYEQAIPSQGVITKTPDGIGLPKLEAEARRRYKAMRPELHLDDSCRAELGGELLGAMERVLADVDSAEVDFYLVHTAGAVQRWLDDRQSQDLVARAEHRRVEARCGRPPLREPLELGPPRERPEGEGRPPAPGEIAVIAGQAAIAFGNEQGAMQAWATADDEGSAEGAFLLGLLLLREAQLTPAKAALERADERGHEKAATALEAWSQAEEQMGREGLEPSTDGL